MSKWKKYTFRKNVSDSENAHQNLLCNRSNRQTLKVAFILLYCSYQKYLFQKLFARRCNSRYCYMKTMHNYASRTYTTFLSNTVRAISKKTIYESSHEWRDVTTGFTLQQSKHRYVDNVRHVRHTEYKSGQWCAGSATRLPRSAELVASLRRLLTSSVAPVDGGPAQVDERPLAVIFAIDARTLHTT